LDAQGLLRLAIESFPGKIAIISAFAAESAVLLHHVARIDPTTPVLFLNTHKLFGETMRYRDRLQETLCLTDIRSVGPHPDDRRAQDHEGTLWSRDPDACCNLRKVVPLRQALAGFDAVVTGCKRFQPPSARPCERSSSPRAACASIRWSIGRCPSSCPIWKSIGCPSTH
jgi:phosphoadenosine phosphosulfate reductase